MKVSKSYILKINTPVSNNCAKTCADSCDKVNLLWEYFDGFENMTGVEAFRKLQISLPKESYQYIEKSDDVANRALCTTAGHFAIWKKVAEGTDDAVVILEHDTIILQPITIDIPDYVIVTLGYKLRDMSRYDYKSAGPPTKLIPINYHHGAHAYAITKRTAQFLINEIERNGIRLYIDDDYFLSTRRTSIPLNIASPTPAIGWVRQSTIWESEKPVRNNKFIPSFQKNYK